MFGPSVRFAPKLESLDARITPSIKAGTGDFRTDSCVVAGEVQAPETGPVGGLWVGNGGEGGRGGIGGEV